MQLIQFKLIGFKIKQFVSFVRPQKAKDTPWDAAPIGIGSDSVACTVVTSIKQINELIKKPVNTLSMNSEANVNNLRSLRSPTAKNNRVQMSRFTISSPLTI